LPSIPLRQNTVVHNYGPGACPALRLLAALLLDPSCVRYVADIPHSEDPYISLLQELVAHLRSAPAHSMHVFRISLSTIQTGRSS
jgi:hypothetical protein